MTLPTLQPAVDALYARINVGRAAAPRGRPSPPG